VITWLSRQTAGLGRAVYLVGDGAFATYKLFMHAQSLATGLIGRMKSSMPVCSTCLRKNDLKGNGGQSPLSENGCPTWKNF